MTKLQTSRRPFLSVLPILVAFAISACGGPKMTEEQLRSAKVSGLVMGRFEGDMAEVKLEESELPPGYKFIPDLVTIQPSTQRLWDGTFGAQLPPVKQKFFQTVQTATGAKGSILYMEFTQNLTDAHDGFISGMLWGDARRPMKEGREDYLMVSNKLVVWCLLPGDPAKTASQRKIRLAIDNEG